MNNAKRAIRSNSSRIGSCLLLLPIFLIPPQLSVAKSVLNLRFKPEQIIEAQSVKLENIARIDSEDDRLAKRFKNLEIVQAPMADYSLEITRQMVDKKLLSAHADEFLIHWSGAEKTTVRTKAQTLDIKKLEPLAYNALTAYLKHHFDGQVTIKSLALPKTINIPDGKLKFSTEVDKTLRSRMVVWVSVYLLEAGDQKMLLTKIPLWFSVSIMAKAYTLRWAMPAHSTITPDDVVEKKINIATLSSDPMISLPERQWSRKALEKGEVLLNADFTRKPAVIAGHLVSVVSRSGAITIQSSAVALQNGNIGERIRVKNANSGQMYSATVIANGRLSV